MIFTGAWGCGDRRQSSIWKNSPFRSDRPVSQSSRRMVAVFREIVVATAKYSSPGHSPICEYSGRCQPVTRFSPKRPSEIESIVDAMRATIAGGITNVAAVAKRRMRCGDGGKARHQREALEIVVPELGLAAEAAQLDHRQREVEAMRSALCTTALFRRSSACTAARFSEISQPLFPIGMKTPDFHPSSCSSNAASAPHRMHSKTRARESFTSGSNDLENG